MTVPHDTAMPPPYDAKFTGVFPSAPPARMFFSDSRMTVPLSDHPTACICPYCHQAIVTRVEKSNGAIVWLSAVAICLLGFVLGCCLIPFCIDDIKDKTHYCPNCRGLIGEKRRLSNT